MLTDGQLSRRDRKGIVRFARCIDPFGKRRNLVFRYLSLNVETGEERLAFAMQSVQEETHSFVCRRKGGYSLNEDVSQ